MPDIQNIEGLTEINPEFIYLTIPAKYVCVYHKLLVYMADFGRDIVNDCNASCKGNGKNILNCWNLFQSAIACYQLNMVKEADFFINYIKSQLKLIYSGTENIVYNNSVPIKIDENGKLEAIVSCIGDNAKFYVDAETGILYEQIDEDVIDYNIKDNNLISTNNISDETKL